MERARRMRMHASAREPKGTQQNPAASLFLNQPASFRMTLGLLPLLRGAVRRLEPRAEGVDQAQREGGLALGQAAVVLDEERLLRHVVAQLETREQAARDLVFRRQ